jgi:hypothetical protein
MIPKIANFLMVFSSLRGTGKEQKRHARNNLSKCVITVPLPSRGFLGSLDAASLVSKPSPSQGLGSGLPLAPQKPPRKP